MEYYVVIGNNNKAQFVIKPEEEEIVERLLKFLHKQGVIINWYLTPMETI